MSTNNPYCPYVEKFTKTSEFTYLADFFKKNKCYTMFNKGTTAYKEFWDDVAMRCKHGMTNSVGIKITGEYFFYLNFIQILGKERGATRKTKIFPRFLDIDYEYFWTVDYAKRNQKGVLLVKPRRLGFSYKAAAIATHEFNFSRDSKSIISAFFSRFSDSTMAMIIDNLNFLNTHTEFRKQRNPDTTDFVKARYKVNLGGVEVWKGYQSEIKKITFKDNEFAAVGQTASVLVMDEAGVFPNIISSYNMSEPTIKDGSGYTGIALVFGSAGSMEGGTQYFYEMFMNPSQFNMLEFPNPDAEGKTMCWFIPATKGRFGPSYKAMQEGNFNIDDMVDEDGNSNEELAKESILFEREIRKKGGDSQALAEHMTQYPLTYKDAFLRSAGSIFPVAELKEHLAHIEASKDLDQSGKPVELYFDVNGKLITKTHESLKEITEFPISRSNKKSSDIDKTGCIVIYEEPQRVNGEIPPFLYIAGCDPYDHDRAENTTSLGSFFVYKRFYQADKTHDIIVAEYTGRPELADDFYENCRKLCIYYNAKLLYENMLKGIKVYFQNKNSLHYLYQTPEILKDIVKDGHVTRGYGVHMTKEIKRQAEIYLKQWLLEDRIVDEKSGRKIMNLHTILCKGLLKELIAYDPEEGNFDRVIAFMLCILQSKELYKISSNQYQTSGKRLVDTDPFFKETYFRKKQINLLN